MSVKSSIVKTYCCYICKERYGDRDKCRQHILTHISKEKKANILGECNIKPISNIYSEKAFREVKIENIVDDIKEEVKDEPVENLEDQNEVNMLTTEYLNYSNMKYENKPCQNYFDTKGNVDNHQTMHTGVKAYHQLPIKQELDNIEKVQKHQCIHCEKSFIVKENLDSHTMSHTGERIYHCSHVHCEKTFTTEGDLEDHRKAHFEGNSFQCRYCDKAFTTNYYLSRHMLSHTGSRYDCGRSGVSKTSLAIHMTASAQCPRRTISSTRELLLPYKSMSYRDSSGTKHFS